MVDTYTVRPDRCVPVCACGHASPGRLTSTLFSRADHQRASVSLSPFPSPRFPLPQINVGARRWSRERCTYVLADVLQPPVPGNQQRYSSHHVRTIWTPITTPCLPRGDGLRDNTVASDGRRANVFRLVDPGLERRRWNRVGTRIRMDV